MDTEDRALLMPAMRPAYDACGSSCKVCMQSAGLLHSWPNTLPAAFTGQCGGKTDSDGCGVGPGAAADSSGGT